MREEVMKEKAKTDKREAVARAALPAAGDALQYFSREEAKISSRGLMTGALAVIALGIAAVPATPVHHLNTHASFATHANDAGINIHSNVLAVNVHANGGSHANTSAAPGHYNINNHASKAAVNMHTSANNHTNANVSGHTSTPATNVMVKPALNQAVVKSNVHNNGAQGKHTAWTAHASAAALHANTAATSAHTNATGLNTHNSIDAHSSGAAVNSHASGVADINYPLINTHYSLNNHVNVAGFAAHTSVSALNSHANSNSHTNHSSHASW